jgi:1,3-beta-galactosyl-N-acetylhexosamine phosphorylase
VVPTDAWEFDEASGEVEIRTIPYHEYTVSFLAFLIWDPVHMYNFITNDWKDTPHQLTYDVRQPKTKQYVKDKLRNGVKTILISMWSASLPFSISLH